MHDLPGERSGGNVETGREELAKALARRASERAWTDTSRATDDINEAVALAEGTKTFNSHAREMLASIQRRLIRLSAGASDGSRRLATMNDIAGEYSVSGGFGGSKLTIRADGTFERERRSDAIDMCTGGRWRDGGTVGREGDYIVVTPDPTTFTILSGETLGPEIYAPARWGDRKYLIEESSLLDFCNYFNSGQLESAHLRWPYHSRNDGPIPAGVPSVPHGWEGWLLPRPIVATVSAVGDDLSLIVSSPRVRRLKAGMLLHGQAPGAAGSWRVTEVRAHSARAIPLGSAHQASRGDKVSSRLGIPKEAAAVR
jgi:hypothetical protein